MPKAADSGVRERALIHVPIIHTQDDMGALQGSIKQVTLQKIGLAAFKHKRYVVDQMWTKIERFIDSLDLSYEKVRLYQDGLPVCDKESEIVKELAKAGNRNHKLLVRLMERGATIMGTESAELLLQEYELIKRALAAETDPEVAGDEAVRKASSARLLKKRNQFIADRINSTLRPDETGILFLGMLHSLQGLLDEDIRVLPFQPTI